MRQKLTFWDHLDELRKIIIQALTVLIVLMVVIFLFKEFVFDTIILAPLNNDFFLWSWIDRLLTMLGLGNLSSFNMSLINIDLAAQFFTHMKISFFLAVILAAPYVFYLIWKFVKPALYKNEIKGVRRSFLIASILFYTGILLGYCFIFPLTLRFLGNYQVSQAVPNQIALHSYITMFLGLIFVMGVVFEMPCLAALLSHLGIINRKMMKHIRKYALVISLILAAIITPSGDAFTMCVVALPLYLLYELSIAFCKKEPAETK